jgi:transposase
LRPTVVAAGSKPEVRRTYQMNGFQYIGLDIHKRTINYCVKTADGKIVEEGRIAASKDKLKSWAEGRQPWVGAMEATLFTHWVYDVLRPYAAELKVANTTES